ncbi:coat protein [Artemisia virus B]|nr:coat protein [Artemisia virus B]
MSTVVVRNNNAARKGRSRRVRRARPIRRTRNVTVVQTVRRAPRRGRRRRRSGMGIRRGFNATVQRGDATFMFNKDKILGDSSGKFVFGKSLSECDAFSNGILRSFHQYKITKVQLQFLSEASSTSAGAISYEIDTGLKQTELKSTLNKFSIVKGGSKTFDSQAINGMMWRESDTDQFQIFYKGSGTNALAGSFKIFIHVSYQNSK